VVIGILSAVKQRAFKLLSNYILSTIVRNGVCDGVLYFFVQDKDLNQLVSSVAWPCSSLDCAASTSVSSNKLRHVQSSSFTAAMAQLAG
jgi:LytS/YehU family sensor histidine kinase